MVFVNLSVEPHLIRLVLPGCTMYSPGSKNYSLSQHTVTDKQGELKGSTRGGEASKYHPPSCRDGE